MKSKYTSGKSVGKNQTVPIDVDDPRLKPGKIGQTKARMGAEIDVVGLDGKSLIMGGRGLNNSTGSVQTPNIPNPAEIVIPRGGNKPPKTYPGGSGPIIIVPTDPTNVTVEWINNDLVIGFDWDYTNDVNDSISQFIVQLTSGGVTKRSQSNIFLPNTSQTRQTITVTKSIITSMFNVFKTGFSAVCVLTGDPLNNISNTICAISIPEYVLSLPVPVITVSEIASGYSVAYTTPTEDVYDAIDIVEYESTSATEPTGVTYTRTYLGTINPANIISSGTNKRWVKARFSSDAGIYTAFSAAQVVTPTSPVVADNDGPPNVGSVTTTGGIDTSGYLGFNAYANISWSAVTTGDIRGYRIRFSNDGGTTYSYADSPGAGLSYRLGGLAVGSTYKIAVATYDQYNNTSTIYVSGTDVTVTGIPSVSNYITAGPFEFGVGVGSVATNKGLYFDNSNYWYINATNSARLKVGGSTSNFLSWDGSDFLIDGNISARKGTFSGNVTIAPGGSLQSFITPPTVFSISAVTYTASTATYTTTANHGYIVGDDILISGLLPEGYNGKFRITAQTLTTFTVTNTTNAAVTDAIGSVIIITGAGFVLNKDGLAFNSSITRDITTINSETGLFTTKSANIGGWNVDSSSISRSGTANISLNSTAGNISVSSQNIAGYTAGINGPYISTGSTPSDNINGTPIGTENVFWAGSSGAIGTSNAFRVTLAGNLYASNAKITGTVSSVGALGTMTMDGEHGYMSLKTAGVNAPVSYLVPRNNNIYLTAPSAYEPWSTGKQISSSGPTNAPYIAAGSEFKDYWNNTSIKGVGLYTGNWDYFTLGSSSPFITASTTGIQLSVSPSLGLLLDGGTAATGTKLNPAIATGTPSMLFYTAKRTVIGPNGQPVYSPNTEYGAWASFTNQVIKLTADEFLFINIEGSDTKSNRKILMKATDTIAYQMDESGIKIQIDNDTHQTFQNDKIKIQATATVYQTLDSAGIKIQATDNIWQTFNSSGIKINAATNTFINVLSTESIVLQASDRVVYASGVGDNGKIPLSGDDNGGASAYSGGSKITMDPYKGVVITGVQVQRDLNMTDAGSGNSYRGISPLGRYPRSRMLVSDPANGQVMLGMAVYYRGSGITSTPTVDTGYAGDLLIDF